MALEPERADALTPIPKASVAGVPAEALAAARLPLLGCRNNAPVAARSCGLLKLWAPMPPAGRLARSLTTRMRAAGRLGAALRRAAVVTVAVVEAEPEAAAIVCVRASAVVSSSHHRQLSTCTVKL